MTKSDKHQPTARLVRFLWLSKVLNARSKGPQGWFFGSNSKPPQVNR